MLRRRHGARGRLALTRTAHRGFEREDRLRVTAVFEDEEVLRPAEAALDLLRQRCEDVGCLDPPSAASAADRSGFEGALDRLDQFLADKTLVLRRARAERGRRLAAAERHRDQALGADKRAKAVARVERARGRDRGPRRAARAAGRPRGRHLSTLARRRAPAPLPAPGGRALAHGGVRDRMTPRVPPHGERRGADVAAHRRLAPGPALPRVRAGPGAAPDPGPPRGRGPHSGPGPQPRRRRRPLRGRPLRPAGAGRAVVGGRPQGVPAPPGLGSARSCCCPATTTRSSRGPSTTGSTRSAPGCPATCTSWTGRAGNCRSARAPWCTRARARPTPARTQLAETLPARAPGDRRIRLTIGRPRRSTTTFEAAGPGEAKAALFQSVDPAGRRLTGRARICRRRPAATRSGRPRITNRRPPTSGPTRVGAARLDTTIVLVLPSSASWLEATSAEADLLPNLAAVRVVRPSRHFVWCRLCGLVWSMEDKYVSPTVCP